MQINASTPRYCAHDTETSVEVTHAGKIRSTHVHAAQPEECSDAPLALPREEEPSFLSSIGRAVLGALDAVVGLAWSLVSAPFAALLSGTSTLERSLSAEERAEARRVFGDSIDLEQVKIGSASGLVRWANQGRDHTIGNEVITQDGKIDMAILMHELTHVWQFQHGGGRYLPKAAGAQLDGALGGAGYDWRRGTDHGKRWAELNPEQQGQLVQDLYQDLFSESPNEERRFKYAPAYQEALRALRAGHGAP